MANNLISFSKNSLNNLPLPPPGKRVYYYDSKTHGLALGITAKGTKTFVVYRKINGKPERITLGRYPDLSVEEARAKAHDVNAAIARGDNPNAVRRAKNAEWSLAELFGEYLEKHAKPHKRSWREDEAQFRRYLPTWHERKLSSLSKVEIQTLHVEIGEKHGYYAANRLLALLQTLFNKAAEWGWSQPNPALGIKKFREKARERFIRADELPRFFAAVAAESNHSLRDYVLLSLLTGARKSNVLAMRWEEINFSAATWRIPQTKNGSAQTVPLVPLALNILQNRRTLCQGSDFVFPGSGQHGHLVEPKKGWQRILQRAQIENLRLHDLRRSLGSWQAATGANLSVIGKTLNHKDMKSTGIYARLDLDPVRAAMDTAVTAILAAAGQENLNVPANLNKND
jgi:integrase